MASVDRLVDYFVVVGMGERPTPVVSDLSGNITSIFDVDPVEGNGDAPDHQVRLDLESWRKGTDAKADIVELGVIFPDVEQLPAGWELLDGARLLPGITLPGVKAQPAAAICCRRRGTGEKDKRSRAIAEVFVEKPLRGRRRPRGYTPIRDSIEKKLDADLTLNLGRRTYLAYRRQRADEHSLYHDDPALVDIEIHVEKDGPPSNEYNTAAITFQTKNMGPYMAVSYRRQEPIGLCDHRYRAEVLEWFPEEEIDGVPIDRASIPMFAFPSGLKLQRAPLYKTPIASFFPFVLTSGAGVSTYVACMTFYEPKPQSLLDEVKAELGARDLLPNVRRPSELVTSPSIMSLADDESDTRSHSSRLSIDREGSLETSPGPSSRGASFESSPRRAGEENVIFVPKCICVSSRLPFMRSFRQWLGQVYTLSMSSTHIPLERCIAHLMFQVPVPEPSGPPVRVRLFPRLEPIDFSLPPRNGLPKTEIPFSVLFECLDTNNVLLLMLSLLLEKPVVLLSKYSSIPTECAECLLALLFPLQWDTIYIPRLTEATLTVLEYPGAALLGVSDEHDPYGDTRKRSQDSPILKTSTSLKQKVVHLCSDEAVLVDLDRNAVWCKSRAETQAIQQVAKDLPGKLVKSLKARWEQTLLYYGVRIGAGPSSLPDAGFDLAPTPDNCDSGGPTPVWCAVADRRIRDGAVVFLASIMEGYKDCLIIPDFNWRTSSEKWFDADQFLQKCDPKLKSFNRRFLETQLFTNFIQFRTESSDPRFLYFDCCVEKLPDYEEAEESRAVQTMLLPERPTLQDLVEENKMSVRTHRHRPSWWKGSGRRNRDAANGGDSSHERRMRRSDSMLAIGKKLAAVANGDRKDEFHSTGSGNVNPKANGESDGLNAPVVDAILVPPPSEEGLPEGATYVYKHNGHLLWPTLDKSLLGVSTSTLTLNLRRRRRAANMSRVLVRTEQELGADLADVAFYLATHAPEVQPTAGAEAKANTAIAEHGKRGGSWGAAQRLALQVFGSWFVCLATMVNATSQHKDQKSEKRSKKDELKPRVDPQSAAMTEFLLGIGFGVMRLLEKMNLTPDEPTYRAMIIACGRGGPAFSRDVGLLLSDMKRAGITPNAVTYGQYTQSVASAGAQDSDAAEPDYLQMMNKLIWLDPSLEILDAWGRQYRNVSAPQANAGPRQRSRSGTFTRSGSFGQASSPTTTDPTEVWCPDFFNAFSATAPVCISTSFELMAQKAPVENSWSRQAKRVDLLRLSTILRADGLATAEDESSGAAGKGSKGSEGEGLVGDVVEKALDMLPTLRAHDGPEPKASAGGPSRSFYYPDIAVAALWSAQACARCGYVALDEEIMESWVGPNSDEQSENGGDAHQAVAVSCPRCKAVSVPSLFVQVYDVGSDGTPIPWQRVPSRRASSNAEGANGGQQGASREGQRLRRGSLVSQAAERAQSTKVNLGAGILDLDGSNAASQHDDSELDGTLSPQIGSPAPNLSSKKTAQNPEVVVPDAFEPKLASISEDSPTLHDESLPSTVGTMKVPYLAPHIVRHAIEHLIINKGESALHRDTLRQEEPELYWNLQWYCCRFRLPLPLFYSKVGDTAEGAQPKSDEAQAAPANEGNEPTKSWIACAAWDKAAAVAAVSTVCGNLYQSYEWHRFWDGLSPGTPVMRSTESILDAAAGSQSKAPNEVEGVEGTASVDEKGPSSDFLPVSLPYPDIPSEAARRALERFYIIHNPTKLDKVPKILKKYKGKYATMFVELMTKYESPATEFAAEHTVLAAVTSPDILARIREEQTAKEGAALAVAEDPSRAGEDEAAEGQGSGAAETAAAPRGGSQGQPSEAKDPQEEVLKTAFRLHDGPSAVEPAFPYPLTMMDGFETKMQQSFFLSATKAGFKDVYRMLGRNELAVNAAIKYYVKQRSMNREGYDASIYRSFLKVVAWSGGSQKMHLVRDRRLGNNFDRPRFEEIFEEKRCFLSTDERRHFHQESDVPPKRSALNCRSMFGHLF